MRYENLRWLLVIAGIGLLVIFHNAKRGQDTERWLDEAPQESSSAKIDVAQGISSLTSKLPVMELPVADLSDSMAKPLSGLVAETQLDNVPQLDSVPQLDNVPQFPMLDNDMSEFEQLDPPSFPEAENRPFAAGSGQVTPASTASEVSRPAVDEYSIEVGADALPLMEEDVVMSSLEKSGHVVRNPMFDEQPAVSQPNSSFITDEEVVTQLPPPLAATQTSTGNTASLPDAGTSKATPRRTISRKYDVPRAVEVRAIHHVEYGKSLARRGALYAARQEFYGALRIIAQSIDIQDGSQNYSQGLASAFTAMKEADDFYMQQIDVEQMADVEAICLSHQTQILSQGEIARLSPAQAMQAYFAYAQQLMVRAGGNSVVAGEALYSLGRLYSAKAKTNQSSNTLDLARAIVHHQAALECDPMQYKAANEVGVLLSQTGQLHRAAEMLQHSLRANQTAQTWNNLANIHQRLANSENPQVRQQQTGLAQMAKVEYQRMLNQPTAAASPIQWVEPAEFSAMSGGAFPERTASAINQTIAVPTKEKGTSFMGRIKDGLSKKLR